MDTLSLDDFKKMLNAALTAVKAREQEFSELDAITGDGDHGTAIVQAMTSVVDSANTGTDYKKMCNDIGFNIMLTTSGSTSTLLGGFFLGMSDAAEGETLTIDQVKQAFQGALDGVRKNTKAAPGDKTMMDALVPAVEAMQASSATSVEDLLNEASRAALEGAAATVQMKANFGRARNYGEKSIGYADSGATSWACMFESFANALK